MSEFRVAFIETKDIHFTIPICSAETEGLSLSLTVGGRYLQFVDGHRIFHVNTRDLATRWADAIRGDAHE